MKDHQAEFAAFIEELRSESPRAAGVLGAAYLDEALGELLAAKLAGDKRFKEPLMDATRGGLLGNFAARIHMAYAVGLISREAHANLLTIAKIRNRFAHRLNVSFDTPEVAKLVAQLDYGPSHPEMRLGAGGPARDRYQIIVSMLITYEIARSAEDLQPLRERRPMKWTIRTFTTTLEDGDTLAIPLEDLA